MAERNCRNGNFLQQQQKCSLPLWYLRVDSSACLITSSGAQLMKKAMFRPGPELSFTAARNLVATCTRAPAIQIVQDRPLTAIIMFSNQQGIPGVDHCSYQRTMQPESHSPEQESSPPSCTRRRSPGSSTASGPTTARRRRAWLPAAPGGSRRPPGPARPPTGRAWSAPRSAPECLHPQRRNNSVFGRFRVQKFRVWHGHGGARQNYAQQSVRIEPSQLWVAVNNGGSGMSASDTSCQHWIRCQRLKCEF